MQRPRTEAVGIAGLGDSVDLALHADEAHARRWRLRRCGTLVGGHNDELLGGAPTHVREPGRGGILNGPKKPNPRPRTRGTRRSPAPGSSQISAFRTSIGLSLRKCVGVREFS